MKTISRTFLAFSAAALLASPSLAFAQQDPPKEQPRTERESPRAEATAESSAQGELVKVDADAKMIAIKSADGRELQFSYTDATEVSGSREGVAGLATKAGSKVTVHFTEKDGSKVATRIEVQS
jgi:hypothetical protein